MAELIRASQMRPFGPPGSPTQVMIEFHRSIGPPTVEFFEIYATTDIGSFDAKLVETVEAKTDPEYSVIIDLVAGMLYELRICPRTTTNGVPNREMDGKPWEDWCVTTTLATQVDAGSFPKPVIFSAIPRHTTLRHKNQIRIQWESPREYTFYQVRFGDERSGFREQQVDRIAGGIGGVFTLEPTIPGVRYLFKVNGLMRHFSETGSSGFTEPVFVTAAANTRSVRAFMDGVDTTGGIRSLFPANTFSLRGLLGI